MSFHSLYDQGFARVATLTFPVQLANPQANATEILTLARRSHEAGAILAVTPELSLTGYSNDDLFLQNELQAATVQAVDFLLRETRDLLPVLLVGAPLVLENRLFNCALFIHRGKLLAVTPKYHLPNYREFYDKRYFSAPPLSELQWVEWAPSRGLVAGSSASALIPFGLVQLRARDLPGFNLCAEICEDMWVPVAPSLIHSLRGATVVANLSASPVTVGRARNRANTVESLSARGQNAYIYTAAGFGESSTDLSWDGQVLIYEAGTRLAASERFTNAATLTLADIDLAGLQRARLQQNSFGDNAQQLAADAHPLGIVEFTANPPRDKNLGLQRPISRFPFVPDDESELDSDCWESFHIQVNALCRRLEATRSQKLVIGVSGGLDSTHALLVAARAMDQLGRERSDVLAYTMPGFGTTSRSRGDAEALCRVLGVHFEELDIRPAAKQMLKTMGHPAGGGAAQYDVTYENVQAGLRTDYLFRLANQHSGIVVGTGDLSELALGWCTYGVGDQMSHYGVNVGLPKTMMQHLIRWVSASGFFGSEIRPVLENILSAEISPELIPPTSTADRADAPGAGGEADAADAAAAAGATAAGGRAGANSEKPQSTQATIGPYALHDFALYQVLQHGMGVRRIAFLAEQAWANPMRGRWPRGISEADRVGYDLAEIVKWLRVFCQRFFQNQFKRSAIPNGPKMMAGGALSPRGDWRMPSDASAAAWLAQLDQLEAELGLASPDSPESQDTK